MGIANIASFFAKQFKARGRLQRMRGKRLVAGVAGGVTGYGAAQLGRTQSLFRKRGLRTIGKKLGIFGKGGSVGEDPDYTLPSLEQPSKIPERNGPELSTIEAQLEELAKVVFKIAIAMNKQQESLITQVKQKERAAKENKLEKPAEQLTNANDNDLSPLGDTFSSLIAKINELTGVINEKVSEGESSEGGGIGGGLLEGAAAGALLGGAPTAVKKASLLSRGVSGAANIARAGGGVLARGAAAAGTRLLPLGIAATAAGSGLISRGKTGIASLAKSGSNRFAGLLGRANKKAGAAGSRVVNSTIIKRLAAPIIGKAVGKTALKSIPIIGAVAGLGFAIGRLLEGDVVGAGLDAASGLAGPFTAIPALIATVARDVYTGAYGIPPEQDPQVGERMGLVTSAVKESVTETLSKSAEVKEPATGKKYEPALPTPKVTPSTPPSGSDPNIPQPTSMPSATSEQPTKMPKGGKGGGRAPSGSADRAATDSFDKGQASASTASEKPAPTPPPTPSAGYDEKNIEPEPTKNNAGQDIQKASMDNENLANNEVPNTQTQRNELPKPAKDITSRAGATGIGNVPDPNYGDVGSIAEQLYFSVAV